jgi:predicted permease
VQRWLWRFWHRVRALLLRDRVEQEIGAEFDFHLAEETNALVQAGMAPAAARAEARRRFGSRAAMADRIRDTRRRESHLAEDLRIDLQFAWRVMRRSPLFVIIAASTIALGVAATAAVFSVVDAVLLQSLPYSAYDRLVVVWRENLSTGQDRITLSPADFLEYQAQSASFSSMGAARGFAVSLSVGAAPVAGSALQVTPDLITTLGVTPVLGRAISASAANEGAHVAMITYEFWQRALAGDSAVIGREIGVRSAAAGPVSPQDGQYTIIGVLPPRAQLPYREADVWLPLAIENERHARVGGLLVFGQLRPSVSLEQANVDISAITARIAERFPEETRGETSWLITLRREDVGDITPTLVLLAASVVLLCLIVCANLGNMLLSRLAERRREFSVRRAIGAHRSRLVRQILTESLCFGAIGAVVGVLLAFWLVQGIAAGPVTIPRINDVHLGVTSISAAVLAALFMSLAFGLVPAARLGRSDSLSQLSVRGSGSALGVGLREALVALEVAMAFAVVTGAGMVIASARRLEQSQLGYNPSGVMTFRVALPRESYATRDARAAFHLTLIDKLRALPGVIDAGAVNTIPQMDADGSVPFQLEGAATTDDPLNSRFRLATPGYFRSIGIPIEGATDALARDPRTQRSVAISRSLKEQLFPNSEALGRRLRVLIPGLDTTWLPIVAVVGDVRQWVEASPNPTMYLLNVEQPGLAYAVRTSGNPIGLASAIRAAVTSIDPQQPVFDMVTMEQRLRRGQGLSFARFRTLLMSAFACVVAILAAVGIYGVVRNAAVSRTKEFAVRVALGASRGAIVRMVLTESLRSVVVGLALGVALALAGGRLVAAMLYGVASIELVIIAAVAAFLALVTLGAATGPAWRAGGADPLLALRGS